MIRRCYYPAGFYSVSGNIVPWSIRWDIGILVPMSYVRNWNYVCILSVPSCSSRRSRRRPLSVLFKFIVCRDTRWFFVLRFSYFGGVALIRMCVSQVPCQFSARLYGRFGGRLRGKLCGKLHGKFHGRPRGRLSGRLRASHRCAN